MRTKLTLSLHFCEISLQFQKTLGLERCLPRADSEPARLGRIGGVRNWRGRQLCIFAEQRPLGLPEPGQMVCPRLWGAEEDIGWSVIASAVLALPFGDTCLDGNPAGDDVGHGATRVERARRQWLIYTMHATPCRLHGSVRT